VLVIHLTDDKDNADNSSSDNPEMFLEGYADDSESALATFSQAYDTEDTEPTYDLYAEVGTPNTYSTVQTSSDFGPDSEECSSLEEGSCIDLGREKTVMPSTLQSSYCMVAFAMSGVNQTSLCKSRS
jgi:hypothetical protein